MQHLQKNMLFKFNSDTMTVVRSAYNLDKPGQMEEAVDILDAWVQKQHHFIKTDFPREYLERVIIQLKGSVERAKSQLDKICTLRTMLPKFFEINNPRDEMNELNGYCHMTLLPNLTRENHRIFFMKLNAAGQLHSQRKTFLIYVYCIMVNEYIKTHDYCDGLITICDLRGVQITDFISHLNLTELRQIATIAMEGYDARLKSIHFISTSKAIDLLMKILKQILSAKIGSRIHVHKTVEEIFEFVPQSLLPKDYGGEEATLDKLHEQCLDAFNTEENIKYLKEMRNTRTDETRRPVSTFNESDLGLAGTFRTLNLD